MLTGADDLTCLIFSKTNMAANPGEVSSPVLQILVQKTHKIKRLLMPVFRRIFARFARRRCASNSKEKNKEIQICEIGLKMKGNPPAARCVASGQGR